MAPVTKVKQSKGSEALSELIEKRGAAKDLAEKVGVGADRISVWARGLHRPDIDARKLFIPFGIGLFDWDEPAEPKASTGPEAA
jgi:hypothetical protein